MLLQDAVILETLKRIQGAEINMLDIIKIVIKGSSGYGPGDMAYTDKLTIESDCITYEYVPVVESEDNPKRRWRYKTNSPTYRELYGLVVAKIPDAVINRDKDEFCPDIGGIEFIITFSDKNKWKHIFWIPGYEFDNCFGLIKKMIPGCEETPSVLL